MLAKEGSILKNLSKLDYSILIVNAVDHFDTALYGFLSPILAPLFFPTSDPIISLILTYSVFASTIITRPLGAYIFGIMAMIYGPAPSLSYSLLGVGLSTFALGLIPSYDQIGFYAPLCLIITRFLGGIFSAGEITIARLYILSKKDKNTKSKSSYMYQTSVMVGIVLASFISTIILKFPNTEYWRIGFIVGGIITLLGYMIRNYQTQIFRPNTDKIVAIYYTQALKTLWSNKTLLLVIAITSGFSYMTYSIPFIIMNNLIPEFTSFTTSDLMTSNTWLLVIDMILLPIIGAMLYNFEIKTILILTTTILSLSIIPIWYPITNSSLSYIIFIKICIIIIGVIFSNNINLWYDNLTSTDEKYFIVGIGSSIGSAVIGKMTPAICLTLYYYTKSSFTIAWFVLSVSIMTVLAIISMKSQHR